MQSDKIIRGANKFLMFYTGIAFVLFFLMPKSDLGGIIELLIIIPAAVVVLVYSVMYWRKKRANVLSSFFNVSVIILVVAALSFLMQTLRDQIILHKELGNAQLAIESENMAKGLDVQGLKLLVEAGGNPSADYQLGAKLFVGWGIPQNRAKGLELIARAAEASYQKAQIDLGKLYWQGNGVEKDLSEAEKWLHKASLPRNVDGYQASLALLAFYEDNQWYAAADKLCDKVMKMNPHYADSIYYVKARVCINQGRIKEAEKYARIAYFDKYIPEAGLVLGIIYREKGKPREAEKVLLALSKKGNRTAMQQLTELYRENNNAERAEFWEDIVAMNINNWEELFHD